MEYVTIKNGVATPITERKQLYYASNYEWVTHVDLHNPDGIESTDVDFAINFNDRRPVAINVQIIGSRQYNDMGLYDQKICCEFIYSSGSTANCGIHTSVVPGDQSTIETIKKGIFIGEAAFKDIIENVTDPQFDKPINCNILIEDIEETYKIYSDNKYIGESKDSRIFNIFDSTKRYVHSFEIGNNCKCTDVIIKYKFHR